MCLHEILWWRGPCTKETLHLNIFLQTPQPQYFLPWLATSSTFNMQQVQLTLAEGKENTESSCRKLLLGYVTGNHFKGPLIQSRLQHLRCKYADILRSFDKHISSGNNFLFAFTCLYFCIVVPTWTSCSAFLDVTQQKNQKSDSAFLGFKNSDFLVYITQTDSVLEMLHKILVSVTLAQIHNNCHGITWLILIPSYAS